MTPAEAIADLREITNIVNRGNLAPALEKCKDIVRRDIKQNFASSSAPDGAGWPPRKHIGDGHPLLIDTGFLQAAALGLGPGGFDEIQATGPAREMTIGIDKSVEMGGIPAAGVHNFGGGPQNMPEREFYAATEDGLDECADVIGDATYALLMGGGD